MSLGHVRWPGGTAGSAHSSVASCRTVARSLMVNPAGSTSRRCRLGGRVDSMNVILVRFGTARHSAVSLADPGPIMTPPGFTPLTDGWAVALTAGACDAAPDEAVPAPATVVPHAASTIMSPAVMPPSTACPAAPSGLPGVLIATPSGRGAVRAAPRWFTRHGPPPGGIRGAGLAARGRPRGLGAGRARCAHARRSVLVRAGLAAPNPPAHIWTPHGKIWFPRHGDFNDPEGV